MLKNTKELQSRVGKTEREAAQRSSDDDKWVWRSWIWCVMALIFIGFTVYFTFTWKRGGTAMKQLQLAVEQSEPTQKLVGPAAPNTDLPQAAKATNKDNDRNIKREGAEELQLELRPNQAQLAPGDCIDLHLDVFNLASHPVHWSGHWVLEQDVPFPIPPEVSLRGSSELPPGKTSNLVNRRICHTSDAHLIVGTYRLRINAAPRSANPPRSNWVSIQVLP